MGLKGILSVFFENFLLFTQKLLSLYPSVRIIFIIRSHKYISFAPLPLSKWLKLF